MSKPTLSSLNTNDNAAEMGGILLAADGQGNQLWAFGDKVANRYQHPDGGEFVWDDDLEGWNYSEAYIETFGLE